MLPPSPVLNLSQHQGLFQRVSSSHKVTNYWSFSFSISPSNEYSGLVSLGLNDLISLVSKEFLSHFQHHNSKASILQHSAFNMVQLSLPYTITGKTIALTIQTFVGKMMTRFLICYLGLSLLFLQEANIFNFVAAVIIHKYLEPKKIKPVIVSHFFSYLFAMKRWDQIPQSSFFEYRVLSQLFHSPISPSSKGFLVPPCSLPLKWYHLHI